MAFRDRPNPSAVVMVIVDGLSDVAPTALESASTPTLDLAASLGRLGLVDPVLPGLACGSDTAHLSIFGYNPLTCYRGRGALEALGAGVSLAPGSIAFKANFAALRSADDSSPVVATRCASNHPDMNALGASLASSLNGIKLPEFPNITVQVHHAGAHRCNVAFSGADLSDVITDTDPLVDNRPLQFSRPVDPDNLLAVFTADVVNHFSDVARTVLAQHPTNTIAGVDRTPISDVLLLRGAARNITVQRFRDRHAIDAFLIAPTHIIAGVAVTIGLPIIHVPGATGGYDTNLRKKATACVNHLMLKKENCEKSSYKYSLGIIHVKAVDEAAHEQDVKLRTVWMEKVDDMVKQLLRELHSRRRHDVVLIVTGDHSSPATYGDHTCEPVPILYTDVFNPDVPNDRRAKYIFSDEADKFTETCAGSFGSIGRFPASEFMTTIKNILRG